MNSALPNGVGGGYDFFNGADRMSNYNPNDWVYSPLSPSSAFDVANFNTRFVEVQNELNGIKTQINNYKDFQFTYIVDSNQALKDWAENKSGNDYSSVLIKKGSYTLTRNADPIINLTSTNTNIIVGEDGSFIDIYKSNSGTTTCILYESRQNDPNKYIYGLNLSFHSTSGRAIYNCCNLTNCSVEVYGSSGSIAETGYENCTNLFRCKGVSNGTQTLKYAYGFRNCVNVKECIGNGTNESELDNTGVLCGFAHCTCVENCTGYGYATAFFDSYYSLTADSTYACNNTLNGGWNVSNIRNPL